VIDAPIDAVWAALSDIPGHVRWMDDAVSLTFTSAQRTGVGTAYDCKTKIGPFRTTDRMEITEWEPGRTIGVRHVGLVTGEGRLSIKRVRGGRTQVRWDERLHFPRKLGGPVTATAARPVLRRVWAKNLRNLEELLTADGA
jgi:uncharacterized protein YndB with AHSA1/START domain